MKNRPTEIGAGVLAAIAFLLGRVFGWDDDVQSAIILILAFVPGAITWIVELLRRPMIGSELFVPGDNTR